MSSLAELTFGGDVAIVTGGGRGLGRFHALELARRGARVVVNDLGGDVAGSGENASFAESVVGEIRALGGRAVANHDSVATPDGGASIVRQAIEEFGRVDIVVNNAGILRDRAFHKFSPDLLEPVLNVHLSGAFNVTQPAWVHMRNQGHGRVINTTSSAGLFGNFGQANYGAAKTGLVGFTRVLAVEGRSHGIRVNAIAPAAATRMTEGLLGERGQVLKPELVSPVVAFLAHRDCQLSGQILSVGGGHVSAVLLSVTRGITDRDLSAEVVRDRLEEIFEPAGAIVPRHIGDELKLLVDALGAA
jgi:NAD(P)-dependent dehydrogenase (short-subunit alcohol dehydrogenase family)